MVLSITTSKLSYKRKDDLIEARLWMSERTLKVFKNLGFHEFELFPSYWPSNMACLTAHDLLYDRCKIFVDESLPANKVIEHLHNAAHLMNKCLKQCMSSNTPNLESAQTNKCKMKVNPEPLKHAA